MRRIDQVVEVFEALGGTARRPDDYPEATSDDEFPMTWQDGFLGRIHAHSSDAAGCLKEDRLEGFEGGIWKLSDVEIDAALITERRDLSAQDVVARVWCASAGEANLGVRAA
ncbi:MAG: hypothetical protein AAFR45_08420 [Pseudomonadota bacterium]